MVNKKAPVILASLLAMDGAWILGFARSFYKKQLGHLMGETKYPPIVAFYLVYTYAILRLTEADSIEKAALRGALLGAASYGAFNFTNHAILKGWTTKMTLIDLCWGTGMTATAAALANKFGS